MKLHRVGSCSLEYPKPKSLFIRKAAIAVLSVVLFCIYTLAVASQAGVL